MSQDTSLDSPKAEPVAELVQSEQYKLPVNHLDRKRVVKILEDNDLHDMLPDMYNKIPFAVDDGSFNELCSLFEMVINQTNSIPEFKDGTLNLEFEARLGKFIKTTHKSYFNAEQKYHEFNKIITYLIN
mgnify:FL=1